MVDIRSFTVVNQTFSHVFRFEYGSGSKSCLYSESTLNFSKSAFLKFHLGIGRLGVGATRAGYSIRIGLCCDRGNLSNTLLSGGGRPLVPEL